MLTFEAEKHENIVSFVLSAVVPAWEIVCLGAEALSVGGHRSRFEAGVRRERGGAAGAVSDRSRVVGVERSRERVLQQRANRHGTHPPGNGCDGAGNGGDGIEIDIAHHAEARGARRIGHAGGAHIDHRGAGLDHVGRDKTGAAEGDNEDVGGAAFGGEIGGAAVHAGYSAIGTLFLQHELRGGLPHDVAAPHHDTLFAGCGDAVVAQEGEDAQRRGTHEGG